LASFRRWLLVARQNSRPTLFIFIVIIMRIQIYSLISLRSNLRAEITKRGQEKRANHTWKGCKENVMIIIMISFSQMQFIVEEREIYSIRAHILVICLEFKLMEKSWQI
jgi:hypothetical protein